MASIRSEHQPAKIMALEGHYESHPDGAPLNLFGWPNDRKQRLDYAVGHSQAGQPDPGPRSQRAAGRARHHSPDEPPRRGIIFWSFRIMVGIGLLMLALGWSLWARWREALRLAWLHKAALVMGPSGFVAVIAGWSPPRSGGSPSPSTACCAPRTASARWPRRRSRRRCCLRGRLFRGVRHRHLVHPEADGQAAAAGEPSRRPRSERRYPPAGITPGGPAPRRARGTLRMDLTIVWAFVIAFRRVHVCGDGRVRSRHRHPVPSFRPGEERNQAMNAIAPVWDGNETWLVLGGGGLMAAFPLAYAIILPALYPLIIAMLLALVFRGVAFEYRRRDPAHERFWDFAFFAGFAGRRAVAGHDPGRAAAGHSGRRPRLCRRLARLAVALFAADRRGVVVGYALLGSCFLAMKVTGEAEERAYRLALRAGFATLVADGRGQRWRRRSSPANIGTAGSPCPTCCSSARSRC